MTSHGRLCGMEMSNDARLALKPSEQDLVILIEKGKNKLLLKKTRLLLKGAPGFLNAPNVPLSIQPRFASVGVTLFVPLQCVSTQHKQAFAWGHV